MAKEKRNATRRVAAQPAAEGLLDGFATRCEMA
jgi:hypothetical protein